MLGSLQPDVRRACESVMLVGTFPPTECGIATYTANLRKGLETCGLDSKVLRVVDETEVGSDTSDVVGHWVRSQPAGAASAAALASPFDSVLVQHEFGIYPGVDGVDVVAFVEMCRPAVFTVLHTVLETPTSAQHRIVDALAQSSELVVVHTTVAAERLLRVQDLPLSKVAIVPHGAIPNLSAQQPPGSVEPILLTWGLLGPGKGIERGIEAVAQMRSAGLDVRYLVAGQTHPNVLLQEGERYRESLQELARARGVADLVDFSACYRTWDSLRAIVRSADVVLLPYDTRDQVTSGVLVEALAAGKPVVATAFPHAIELSATGAVIVVDHGSPGGIASTVMTILTDQSLRATMQAAARVESARYDWPIVGERFHRLMTRQLQSATPPRRRRQGRSAGVRANGVPTPGPHRHDGLPLRRRA
jgi:glycosyltransferase involved in cell wall biosynthesis